MNIRHRFQGWMKRRGLTLVEVLIAIVLLSIAVLVVLGLLPSMIRLGKGSERQAIALADANAVMDYLTSQQQQLFQGEKTFDIIGPEPGVLSTSSPSIPVVLTPLSGNSSTNANTGTNTFGVVKVSEVEESNSTVVDVTVTVQWTDQNGIDRTVAVNGAFSAPGANSGATRTLSASNTVPVTRTNTSTQSATATNTRSSTTSLTATQSVTATASVTATSTNTKTRSLSATRSLTISATQSVTPTPTISATATNTKTKSLSATPTLTISATQSVTATPSLSSTPTNTKTTTVSATPSLTSTPTNTQTVTATKSLTATPTNTITSTNPVEYVPGKPDVGSRVYQTMTSKWSD